MFSHRGMRRILLPIRLTRPIQPIPRSGPRTVLKIAVLRTFREGYRSRARTGKPSRISWQIEPHPASHFHGTLRAVYNWVFMLAAISRLPDYRLRDPQLAVTWESRRRNLSGSLRAVLGGPRAPRSFLGGPYFRDSWVPAPWPKRALLASALWHIVLIFIPLPHWKGSTSQAQLTMPQIEVTWYGPIRDLPQVNPDGPPSRPSPPGEPNKPVPRRGADAYHPRQAIISAPKIPTHPRQTLIQPDAPPDPPKILPQIPNIVQWADASQPARPRLQINLAVLAKLRPKRPRVHPASELPLPEVPNLEQQAGELNIASSTMTVPKPQLRVPATSVLPAAGRCGA